MKLAFFTAAADSLRVLLFTDGIPQAMNGGGEDDTS